MDNTMNVVQDFLATAKVNHNAATIRKLKAMPPFSYPPGTEGRAPWAILKAFGVVQDVPNVGDAPTGPISASALDRDVLRAVVEEAATADRNPQLVFALLGACHG